VAALFGAPLAFGAVQAWAWASLACMAASLLFLWGLECVQQGALKVDWSPLYLPAVLFLLLGTIQFLTHHTMDAIGTRESLLKLLTDLILFFLAGELLVAGSPKVLRTFALSVVVYAFLLALFAILQFFSSGGLIYWSVKTAGNPFGPYVNRSHYAGLMEMLIPLAATYVLSRPQRSPWRAWLGVSLLLPLASVLLAGTRGGVIALAVELAILLVIVLRHPLVAGGRGLAVGIAMGAVGAAALFFYLDSAGATRRLESVAKVVASPQTALGERGIAARDALRILRDYRWLGTGLGSFDTVFPRYQTLATDWRWTHAHNDYAEALAETGLVGGLLMVSALALFFRCAFGKLAKRLRHDVGWLQLGAAIGCCGLLVHSFVDFNLHIPANAAWFAVLAAVATISPSESIQGGAMIGVQC
jgi:O-antigen ligase